MAQGAIEFLLSDSPQAQQLRSQFTFLIIPMLDPDATAEGIHENIIHKFIYDGDEGPEPQAYAQFFKQWIDSGKPLNLMVDLHNMNNEKQSLQSPLMEPREDRLALCQAFHDLATSRFEAAGYSVLAEPWKIGTARFRLAGYLAEFYGPLFMAYEVNAQSEQRHLSLEDMKEMGELLVLTSAQFLQSPAAQPLAESIEQKLAERQARWAKYGPDFISARIDNALQIEWVSWERDVIDKRKQAAATQPSPQ